MIINYSGRYDESDTEDPSDWYLSAIIVKNDNIAYYGKIKKLSNKSDESCEGVIINIPEGVTLHPYDSNTIMYVFCETSALKTNIWILGVRSSQSDRILYPIATGTAKKVTGVLPR